MTSAKGAARGRAEPDVGTRTKWSSPRQATARAGWEKTEEAVAREGGELAVARVGRLVELLQQLELGQVEGENDVAVGLDAQIVEHGVDTGHCSGRRWWVGRASSSAGRLPCGMRRAWHAARMGKRGAESEHFDVWP